MTFIWSYLFVFLASFFNACMDAFENTPNFDESIFRNLDKKFWCKDVSWEYAIKVFKYKLDSWHISKSLMIICICSAGAILKKDYLWWAHLIKMGVIWNGFFWLFYHKIFRVK